MTLGQSPDWELGTFKEIPWLPWLSRWAKEIVPRRGFGVQWNVGPYSPRRCKQPPRMLNWQFY